MRPLIIANWKMNFTLEESISFASKLEKIITNQSNKIIIACPVAYILKLREIASKIEFCTQDISLFNGEGAYTGELSAKMIKSCGVNYSIIGHSERRKYFNEENSVVSLKVKNCLDEGITPIVCFGESIEERKTGHYKEILFKQINESLPHTTQDIILAYEPLWSVGSQVVASKEEIAEIVEFIQDIRQALVAKNLILVYGGSVNSKNYNDIVTIPGIEGVLVGKAALNIEELTTMIG